MGASSRGTRPSRTARVPSQCGGLHPRDLFRTDPRPDHGSGPGRARGGRLPRRSIGRVLDQPGPEAQGHGRAPDGVRPYRADALSARRCGPGLRARLRKGTWRRCHSARRDDARAFPSEPRDSCPWTDRVLPWSLAASSASRTDVDSHTTRAPRGPA